MYEPKRETSGQTQPGSTLLWELRLKNYEKHFLVFKPPTLVFCYALLTNEYRGFRGKIII